MSATKTVNVSVDKLPMNMPSLCIPRVFPNITWKRVKDALEDVGLGEIERVDMVVKKNEKGESFKRVFIHFKKWESTPEATAAREMVLGGDMFQVTYDDPWYWKIGMSHADKPDRKQPAKKTMQKKRTRPTMSMGGKTKRASDTTSSDTAALRKLVEDQRRELETLRIAVGKTTYTPSSPEYHPASPIPRSPPPLMRHNCMIPDVSDDCGTVNHIARELETEFEETS